ncbi:M48 family metalloprotease [Streptomyces actuosus]|uniref:M48 family metalloprotease n=1 Tax=Streptomyces actuosus TaxID=1885 RepID=A0ABS2VM61_STRAS|nr:M48 family metalloprotease [Streptomyces actuosus]MBN0044177.1 M48 family metalloprotease [Streptomyces actuosus]
MTQPPPTPPEHPGQPATPPPGQTPPYPQQPQYPQPAAAPQQPQYPQQPQPAVAPQYPQQPQPAVAPQYPQPPGAGYPPPQHQPQQPGPGPSPFQQAAPGYPQAPQPPQPPGYPAAPHHPGAPGHPYPQAPTSAAVPPQYPQAPAQPAAPPPAAPAAPQAPAAADDTDHPHHISTGPRRVHISAHQRRTDATTVGSLLLHLPNFLCSLFVVALISLLFGDFGPVLILAWLATGALVFHRPTERTLARHLLRLRYPTPQERAKLEPVWQEVTTRAGVDGRIYELWVEDSDHLNAVAAAGHIVGVTRFAMTDLPNGELAAVMAHELGHHVGGHAWSGLLGYWYALPGRIAWRVLRVMTTVMFQMSQAFSCFGVLFFGLIVGGIALVTVSSLYGLPLLVLGVPYALAAVGRRSELRADQHAAALGFAPMLASVLEKMHHEEEQAVAALAARNGGSAPAESPVSKLLASHPDYYTRLHHLQPYLQPQRH